MLKKIILVFITLIIFMPCVFADTTFKFKMTEDGSGIYIDEYTGSDTVVFIMPYYEGMCVKGIGKRAFEHSNVVEVYLPETVEWIEQNAFNNCRMLRTINFPSSLQIIGWRAFYYCVSLSDILFPYPLHQVSWGRDNMNNYDAFLGCSSLTMYSQMQLIKMGYPDGF